MRINRFTGPRSIRGGLSQAQLLHRPIFPHSRQGIGEVAYQIGPSQTDYRGERKRL